MSMEGQILLLIIICGFSVFGIRGVLLAIGEAPLKRNESRRRRGQTFTEWLFYSRYRKEIPKLFIILYYIVLVIHSLLIICTCLALFWKWFRDINIVLIWTVGVFDLVWSLILTIITWKPKDPWAHYERLVSKNRKKKK